MHSVQKQNGGIPAQRAQSAGPMNNNYQGGNQGGNQGSYQGTRQNNYQGGNGAPRQQGYNNRN
jgi:hypothetical protein